MKITRMVDLTIRVGEDSRLRRIEEEVEIFIDGTEAINAIFADTDGFATPGHALLLVFNRLSGCFKSVSDETIASINPAARQVLHKFLLDLAKRFE